MQFHSFYDLTNLNTLAVDAQAEYFCQVQSLEDITAALAFARSQSLPVKVLGGGSNVVMAAHVSGLIVQDIAKGFEVIVQDDKHVTIKVQAGQNWHELVMQTLELGYYGLENLAYIPGCVGAAPVQNIGAYGVEAKDFISVVHGVNLETGIVFSLDNAQCDFSYRESIFKQELEAKVLITSVDFVLNKQESVMVKYAPLNTMASQYFDEEGKQVSALLLAQWVINVRKSKLPEPRELPNAGSFFKNPVINQHDFLQIKAQYPDIPSYEQASGIKIPAGWLIDQLGLKGQSFGPVRVHEKQALVLVNQGGTGEDVIAAASEIKQKVLMHYGVTLEQEPRLFS